MLTACAVRDGYFSEIYHPDTGARYGGLQERNKQGIVEWESEKKQTWSATGYLHMLYSDIIGLRLYTDGIELKPYMPQGVSRVQVKGLSIRDLCLDLTITGIGNSIKEQIIDGKRENGVRIPYGGGKKNLTIVME